MDGNRVERRAIRRKRHYLVAEAAEHLAVSRSKVYQLMEAGHLAYVKIGRCRRIPVSSVLAFVAANRVEARNGPPQSGS